VGVVNPETGSKKMDVLEDERDFDSASVERDIYVSRLQPQNLGKEIKKHALEHEETVRTISEKTLIFAVNDLPHTSHADQLVDIARDVFGPWRRIRAEKSTGSPTVDRPFAAHP